MPEQKDMSTPSDWSDKELVRKMRRIRDDFFMRGEDEDKVMVEAMDRIIARSKQ